MGQLASTLAFVRDIRPTGNGWHFVEVQEKSKDWQKSLKRQKWQELLQELVQTENPSATTTATTSPSTTVTVAAPVGEIKGESKGESKVGDSMARWQSLPHESAFNVDSFEQLFRPVYDPKPRAGQNVYFVQRMGEHRDRPAILVRATVPVTAVVGDVADDGGFSISSWVPNAFARVSPNTSNVHPTLASGWQDSHGNGLEKLVVGLGEEQHSRVVFSEGVSRYQVAGVEKAFLSPDKALLHGVQGYTRFHTTAAHRWQWTDTNPFASPIEVESLR